MSSFPGSPILVKGGIVLLDPSTSRIQRVITLQYNPETLTRSLQPRATANEAGDRLEALRLTGPAVETIRLDAEINTTDQLEFPDRDPNASVNFGIWPQLAALEALLHPSASSLQLNNTLASAGTLEITPAETPLTVFVWSQQLVVPVRITEFTITETLRPASQSHTRESQHDLARPQRHGFALRPSRQ